MIQKSYLYYNILIPNAIAISLGFVWGLVLLENHEKKSDSYSSRELVYMHLPNQLFVGAIRSLILPLIVSSIIWAIGSLDVRLVRKIGWHACIFYFVTTFSALILGLTLVFTIQPGKFAAQTYYESIKFKDIPKEMEDLLFDLVQKMFPGNIIQATWINQAKIPYDARDEPLKYIRDPSENKTKSEFLAIQSESMNTMGIITASICFGIAMSGIRSPKLLLFFHETSHLILKLTDWILWFSPCPIISLICWCVIEIRQWYHVLVKVGLFTVIVLLGLFLQGFVVLPAMYFLIVKENPYTFIFSLGEAMLTAFATASSTATLPATLRCLHHHHQIDWRVSRFIVPIGATVNMCGAAVYQSIIAVYIAQYRNIPLTFEKLFAICVGSTLGSIGSTVIPQEGILTTILVLELAGLPKDDAHLLYAADWLLDRTASVVDIVCDAFGAVILSHISRKELDDLGFDPDPNTSDDSFSSIF